MLVLLLCGVVLGTLIWLSLSNPYEAVLALAALMVGAGIARLAGSPKQASQPSDSNTQVVDASAVKPPKSALAGGGISSSALLEATMESMREGVLVVDESMRILASNRAALAIFAQVNGPFESRRLSEVTRNPLIHSAFRAAIEEGERAEVKVEAQGAERRSFDLRVAPLRFDSRERTRGAIGVFFDITQLERLERIRQEFLSNVSHELRTPLTAIIAFVETLEDGAIDDSENNRRFLGVIRKSATRMHNLIDDILDLSSIEAGTTRVEPGRIRLHSMVEEISAALSSRAQARKVALHNEVAPDVVVYADGRRLEQMLTNLIDNAIKFNREDGMVRISHERRERDRIHVEDTGEGIPAEHLARIFERFYRVDRARSREMGGTGLGLAIVKHLARAHGGQATVQSEAGRGSTFTVELPITPETGKEEGERMKDESMAIRVE
jgi:two-component system phosphate regulon sensor histidine kinase PhoR